MLRAERNDHRASASAIDERDLQVLLHLLEHKILTTHQITSLHFRSLRRCQHRMRELKEMGLVSSFSVGRGFGEGRAPACWHLTKQGLVEIADAKDVRTSDLFEYDRATEACGALTRKLEGYLRLAAGWTREAELTGFPNVIVLVPEEEREGEVGSAFRSAVAGLHVSSSLASSFPLYVASEDRLTELGALGPVWKHVPTDGERLSLVHLPARARDLYRTARCLGRYFTDADPGHRRRIAPASATPRFRALPPRHAP